MSRQRVKLTNIDAMSDALYDALSDAFKEELVSQGIDPDVMWEYWSISATYTPIKKELSNENS